MLEYDETIVEAGGIINNALEFLDDLCMSQVQGHSTLLSALAKLWVDYVVSALLTVSALTTPPAISQSKVSNEVPLIEVQIMGVRPICRAIARIRSSMSP